jgi:hypothetical protein
MYDTVAGGAKSEAAAMECEEEGEGAGEEGLPEDMVANGEVACLLVPHFMPFRYVYMSIGPGSVLHCPENVGTGSFVLSRVSHLLQHPQFWCWLSTS